MVSSLSGSRSGTQGGTSPFQVFAVGLAARIGTGDIAGVALTIIAGGPDTLFWMWVTALIDVATSFVESTLAQIFKKRGQDFTFHGGSAYYIKNGLGSALWGKAFAAIRIVSVGVMAVMVQTNSLAQVVSATAPSVSGWMVGVFPVLLTTPVVLGGVRLMTHIAEWLTPIMALAYVLMAAMVIILNIGGLPEVLESILEGAFGLNQALLGTAGGIFVAPLNGVRRGLFSSEAGLETAPNAIGTATVAHPVRQDLIQSFDVLIDTILVYTATGLLILLTTETYHPGDSSLVGAVPTQQVVAKHLGTWATWPVVMLISTLVPSTVLNCYSYAQISVNFLDGEHRFEQIFGVFLAAVAFDSTVLTLSVVWALSNIALGFLGVLNFVIIIRLVPWAIGALRDFEPQRARGIIEPAFVGHGNSLLPSDTVPGIWEPNDVVRRGWFSWHP